MRGFFVKTIIIIFLLFTFCNVAMSEDCPTVTSWDVTDIHLFLMYEAGSISGYLIFYDKEGRECKVKTSGSDEEAILYVGSKFNPEYKKYLNIAPSYFDNITLRGGGMVCGYIIDKFAIPGDWKRITFTFKWGGFERTATVQKW